MNYEDRVTKAAVEAAIEGKCRIVTGTYQGNDTDNRIITLGFTPKLVIVTNNSGMVHVGVGDVYHYGLQITENGFMVHYRNNQGCNSNLGIDYYRYAAFV